MATRIFFRNSSINYFWKYLKEFSQQLLPQISVKFMAKFSQEFYPVFLKEFLLEFFQEFLSEFFKVSACFFGDIFWNSLKGSFPNPFSPEMLQSLFFFLILPILQTLSMIYRGIITEILIGIEIFLKFFQRFLPNMAYFREIILGKCSSIVLGIFLWTPSGNV